MTLPVFTWVPSYEPEQRHEPLTIGTQFGDGYRQLSPASLNPDLRVWSLRFDVRDLAESAAIRSFLTARGGVGSFTWTDPTGETGIYRCAEWSRAQPAVGLYSITATFREVLE